MLKLNPHVFVVYLVELRHYHSLQNWSLKMAWEKYLVLLMECKEMLMALAEKALSQELSYATSLCYHRICCKFASLEIEFRRFLG